MFFIFNNSRQPGTLQGEEKEYCNYGEGEGTI